MELDEAPSMTFYHKPPLLMCQYLTRADVVYYARAWKNQGAVAPAVAFKIFY